MSKSALIMLVLFVIQLGVSFYDTHDISNIARYIFGFSFGFAFCVVFMIQEKRKKS